jgi:hypothetical protein
VPNYNALIPSVTPINPANPNSGLGLSTVFLPLGNEITANLGGSTATLAGNFPLSYFLEQASRQPIPLASPDQVDAVAADYANNVKGHLQASNASQSASQGSDFFGIGRLINFLKDWTENGLVAILGLILISLGIWYAVK